MTDKSWWDEQAGFFGDFYIRGDQSLTGHLVAQKQTLEERTRTEVDGVVRLLGLAQPQRILDVPCGYGRHTIGLARLGYSVLGMDINEAHLRVARERAQQAGVHPLFVKESMLSVGHSGKFDVVINMFYSFGFFETDAENQAVLRGFFQALGPGGKFLMHTDVNLPRVRDGQYRTHELRKLASGEELLIEEHYDEGIRRIQGSWTIKSLDQLVTRSYSVRVYDEAEFRELCVQAGFQKCVSFGDWQGKPYGVNDEEIIFVATK